jgi:ParB family chromosome partitioning protein
MIQGVRAPRNVPDGSLSVGIGEILEQRGLLEETFLSSTPEAVESEVQEIPLERIDVSPYQPRLQFDEADLEQLAESIQASAGLLRPILVRKKRDGRFELIGGERRLRAHHKLGWATIKARICGMDDDEAEINALADNEGEAGLSDYEKGRAYSRILERKLVPSMSALARRIGVHQTTVSRCLAFMRLPDGARKILEKHPKAIGIKLVLKLVELSEKYPDLVVEGVRKVSEEQASQEAALRWIQSEIKRAEGGEISLPESLQIEISGKAIGVVRFSGSSMHLSLSKDADSERILRGVRQYLTSLSKWEDLPE